MKKLAKFIVDKKYIFFGLFMVLTIISAFMIPLVEANYDMTEYLPEESDTVIALDKMEEEFGSNGTAQVMINNVTAEEAKSIVITLNGVNGVSTVVFDSEDEFYYLEDSNTALINIFLDENSYSVENKEVIASIREELEEYDVALGGTSVSAGYTSDTIEDEMSTILAIAFTVIFIILCSTSTSWIEPIIFAIVIGVSIVINMGTNLLLGEISFITKSICLIMQLALAMDYSIVLLHRFAEEKQKTENVKEAMTNALAHSFSPISSSSLTTIAGLVALMFMQFTIGLDVGLVLAKGILISLLSVFLLMPSVVLMFYKLMEKTKHRSFIPKMDKVAKFSFKTRVIVPIILVCVIVASAIIQNGMDFSYSLEDNPESYVAIENAEIVEMFGNQNSLVILVPKGDYESEKEVVAYVNSLTVDGELVVNSSKGMVTTGLYENLNYIYIVDTYGLTETEAKAIISAITLEEIDSITETNTVYAIELLEYMCETDSALQLGIAKEAEIDNQYAELYADITIAEAQIAYSMTEAQATSLFEAITGGAVDNITTVKGYELLSAVYTYAGSPYAESVEQSYLQAYADLTIAQIEAVYGIDASYIENLFVANGLQITDTVKGYELVSMLSQSNLIETIGTATQQEMESTLVEVEMAKAMFESDDYARLIFNIDLDSTSKEAFALAEDIEENIAEIYEEYYVVGESVSISEIKDIFDEDLFKTNLITILSIFLIVLLTFKSLSIPVVLLCVIQGAIWLNMSISVLSNEPIFFACYLIAMCIQMGATIDYGILMTDRYVNFRKTMNRKDAIKGALNASITTILTSGSILILAAYTIGFVSSVPIISSIGTLIGRGSICSILFVMLALPQLLLIVDKIIEKTSSNGKFYNDKN